MRLVLFRHGIAQDRDAPATPADPERALTAKGLARTAAAARGLCKTLTPPFPVRVLHSPYLRAAQSAHIVVEALKAAGVGEAKAELYARMRPHDAPDALIGELSMRDEPTIVVGHAPHLDEMLADFCGADAGTFALKKAGAAVVETDRGARSVITAIYPARVLRALGSLN